MSHSERTILRIGTWNAEWARPSTPRGEAVRAALQAPDCDVLCVTEGYAGLLPHEGYLIDAGPDWGYRAPPGRRKVLLWSRRPWREVDRVGCESLPGGRFVAGTTETPLGRVCFLGVCIPWAGAHVATGRKDRKQWQDHREWLAGFEALPFRQGATRTVVLGDFNQRFPRKRVPKLVHEALLQSLGDLVVATAGGLEEAPGLSIDHIAHTRDLRIRGRIGIWSRSTMEGLRLSDHFGVWGEFEPGQPICSQFEV